METAIITFLSATGMIGIGFLAVYIVSEIHDARRKEKQKRQETFDAMNRSLDQIVRDMEEIQRSLKR